MNSKPKIKVFFLCCRNTPVLLTAVTGCLLACNQFTPGNEPPEIRRQGIDKYEEQSAVTVAIVVVVNFEKVING